MRGVGEEIGRTTRGGGWRWLSLRGEKKFNLLGCLKKKRKRKVIYRLGCRHAKNGLTDLHSRKKEEKEKEKNGGLFRRGIPLQTLDFSFTALRRYAPGRRRRSILREGSGVLSSTLPPFLRVYGRPPPGFGHEKSSAYQAALSVTRRFFPLPKAYVRLHNPENKTGIKRERERKEGGGAGSKQHQCEASGRHSSQRHALGINSFIRP